MAIDDDDDEDEVDGDADVDAPDVVALDRGLPEDLDRRELCPVHGWVGRRAFRRDLHHTCVLGDVDQAPIDEKVNKLAAAPSGEAMPRVQVVGNGRRRIRNPALRRARTIARKHLTHNYMEAEAQKLESFMSSPEYAAIVATRPKTRGDCKGGSRPCPWVACSEHLYLDVNPTTGTIKFNFPDHELEDLRATCALDVADEGVHTLEQVGEFMNLTRERVRQVEVRGTLALRGRRELDPSCDETEPSDPDDDD